MHCSSLQRCLALAHFFPFLSLSHILLRFPDLFFSFLFYLLTLLALGGILLPFLFGLFLDFFDLLLFRFDLLVNWGMGRGGEGRGGRRESVATVMVNTVGVIRVLVLALVLVVRFVRVVERRFVLIVDFNPR